jgi:ATP-dependent exoDNAse (exonuclease V) beta subunit
MANVRQSTIGTIDVCAQRLVYDLDPTIAYTSGIVRALGTAVHAGLEMYYRARMDGEITTLADHQGAAVASLDDEIARAGDAFDWAFQPETARKELVVLDREQSITMIEAMLARYHTNDWFWPPEYEVLAVELKFLLSLPGSDHMAQGFIDLAVRGPDGWIRGVDHKTAKDNPRSDKFKAYKTPQAAYYTWALGEIFEVPNVAFVYDVSTWGGKFFRIEENRSPAQVSATLAKANLVGDLLDAGGPFMPNPTSFLCSQAYCDHWNRCPFGKVLHT